MRQIRGQQSLPRPDREVVAVGLGSRGRRQSAPNTMVLRTCPRPVSRRTNPGGHPSAQAQFKAVHPTSQRFTKTDLAKFENSWDQLPHIVSLGRRRTSAISRCASPARAVPGHASVLRTPHCTSDPVSANRAYRLATTVRWIPGQHRHLHHRLPREPDIPADRFDQIWLEQNISDGLTRRSSPPATRSVRYSSTRPERKHHRVVQETGVLATGQGPDLRLPRQADA